jgi:hypothetical protein
MEVLVTSQNQRAVQQHFGRAMQILSHLTGEFGCRLVEIRQNRPPSDMQQNRIVP